MRYLSRSSGAMGPGGVPIDMAEAARIEWVPRIGSRCRVIRCLCKDPHSWLIYLIANDIRIGHIMRCPQGCPHYPFPSPAQALTTVDVLDSNLTARRPAGRVNGFSVPHCPASNLPRPRNVMGLARSPNLGLCLFYHGCCLNRKGSPVFRVVVKHAVN